MRSSPILGINLASQPFGRERAEIASLAAVCSILAVSLLVFVGLFLAERRQASTLRRDIRQKQQTLNTLDREQSRFQSVIAKPANADVFSKSVFYNELIARRAVSWTLVFEDLERVIPANIQLVQLRLPQVVAADQGDKNHIELEMTVGTQQPQAILTLLKNLQSSKLFGPVGLTSQQPPTQNDPLFRFRLSVPYVQTF
jgi:type IV pilus assembly protein PilN